MMLLLHGVPVGTVKVGETGSVTCQSAKAVDTKNIVISDSFLICVLRGIKKDRLSGLTSGRDREGVLPDSEFGVRFRSTRQRHIHSLSLTPETISPVLGIWSGLSFMSVKNKKPRRCGRVWNRRDSYPSLKRN